MWWYDLHNKIICQPVLNLKSTCLKDMLCNIIYFLGEVTMGQGLAEKNMYLKMLNNYQLFSH